MFATTMPQLVRFASLIVRAPVVDRTGLAGSFDVRQPQPELEPHEGGDQGASFKAFVSSAGFKWEASRGPIEILVIDAARPPRAN